MTHTPLALHFPRRLLVSVSTIEMMGTDVVAQYERQDIRGEYMYTLDSDPTAKSNDNCFICKREFGTIDLHSESRLLNICM